MVFSLATKNNLLYAFAKLGKANKPCEPINFVIGQQIALRSIHNLVLLVVTSNDFGELVNLLLAVSGPMPSFIAYGKGHDTYHLALPKHG